MLELKIKKSFEKDWRRLEKRGYDYAKLEEIVGLLISQKQLPDRCRPHKLVGNYVGFWECHIAPDWLLIYFVDDTSITLAYTGTHSDLF